MESKKFVREDNRIIGGVCSGISVKYDFPVWTVRLLLIVTAWFLFGLSLFIYLILWITIPSRNILKATERKRQYFVQAIGLVIGGLIGATISLELIGSPSSTSGRAYYELFATIVGLVIGSPLGFYIARRIAHINNKK